MLQMRKTRWGELNCLVAEPATRSEPPRLLVALCHGFGAPGSDLAALGYELARMDERIARQAVFVFPEAPLSLREQGLPDGRAWWPLDMVKLQLAIEQGDFRDLRRENPPLLPAAREQLGGCLEEAQREYGLPVSSLVLGGFSQGAMLAADLALRMPRNPAALLIYSGTLLNEDDWKQLALQRAGLRALQSHGRDDPILPFRAAEWLHELLAGAGLQTQFLSFRGGHTIPREALERTAELLASLELRD